MMRLISQHLVVHITFLIFALQHELWVLVRTAIYVLSKKKEGIIHIKIFHLKFVNFHCCKNHSISHLSDVKRKPALCII